jgi:hypothetical protein
MAVSPQIGHSTSPLAICESKASLEANQPSKPWPRVH